MIASENKTSFSHDLYHVHHRHHNHHFKHRDGGRGRGRGGGGGFAPNGPRPSEIQVMVNYNKIELLKPIILTQYLVDIRRGKMNRETKKPMIDTKKEIPLDLDTSSGMSRKVLQQLSLDLLRTQRLTSHLVGDGEKAAYYIHHFLKDENGEPVDQESFAVYVNVECEEYEEHAKKCKHAWFIVSLTKVGDVSLTNERRQNETSRQFLDVLLKSAMMSAGMKVMYISFVCL